MKCANCGYEELRPDFKLCPKCGAPVEAPREPEPLTPESSKPKKSKAPVVFLILALLFTVLIVRCGIKSNTPVYNSDGTVRFSDAEAFTVAEAMVKQELKSPSTAKFCTISQATITHSGDKYTVKGWVDAQNSFGATLRRNWTVTFTAVKSGGKIGGEHGTVTID